MFQMSMSMSRSCLTDLDHLNAGTAGPTDHIGSAPPARECHHQGRAPFIKHLLIADWAGFPAELGPVRQIDLAGHAAGFGPFLGQGVRASSATGNNPDDASAVE